MAPPRMLSPSDYRAMAWKNGGGRTLEICMEPPDADLASFMWRVSLADVERDGPFSAFPGVDRVLVLLSGPGMQLTGAGAPLLLHTPYEPVRFAGEAALNCALVHGATRDFNLMVRRAQATGDLLVVRDEAHAVPPAHAYACFAAAGTSECLVAGFPPIAVAPEHMLLVDADAAAHGMHVNPTSAASIALVAIIDRVDGKGRA
jgi:uncharacterized protein